MTVVAAIMVGSIPTAALAQSSIVIHGRVYDCDDRQPVSHATVSLRLTQRGRTGARVALRTTDRHGDFTIIGVMPGTYLLTAVPAGVPIATIDRVDAQRQLSVDVADVLRADVGIERAHNAMDDGDIAANTLQVRPICDAALVPPALKAQDLYVIH